MSRTAKELKVVSVETEVDTDYLENITKRQTTNAQYLQYYKTFVENEKNGKSQTQFNFKTDVRQSCRNMFSSIKKIDDGITYRLGYDAKKDITVFLLERATTE